MIRSEWFLYFNYSCSIHEFSIHDDSDASRESGNVTFPPQPKIEVKASIKRTFIEKRYTQNGVSFYFNLNLSSFNDAISTARSPDGHIKPVARL